MIIKNDLFNIARRLKQLNRGYFINFNEKNKIFELHNAFLKPTLQLRLPYDRLDSRTIDRVRKSEVVNLNAYLDKIEEDNKKLQMKELESMKEQVMYDVKMLLF